MARSTLLDILVFLFMNNCVNTFPSEPVCSKFDYEIKTMEAMLRTEQKVEKMVEEMKVMQDSVTKDLAEMKDLKIKITSELDSLTKSIDEQVSNQITRMSTDFEVLTKNANDAIEGVGGPLQQITDKDLNVAFSVTNPTKSLVNGVPIFSITITNVGEAYKMDTGVFTSPVDGLYMFVFTVASDGKYDLYCYIQHNGSSKVRGRTNNDNSYTTSSTSVFLILTKGDTVALGDCYGWTHVVSLNYYTTFSGALIKQTNKV